MARTSLVRLPLLSALVLAALSGWLGSGSAAEARSGQAALTTIRVGAISSLGYMPFYIALEKGYFTKHGIKVDLQDTVNVLPALIAGDVDVALMGSDNAFLAAGQGKPTPIITELAQHNVYQFTVRSDLQLPNRKSGWPLNVRDLPKGAIIGASSLAGANLTFAQAILDGAGLKQGTDYTLIAVGQPASMVAALQAKRIDAALLFMPYGNQAETASAGTVLIDQARGEGPPDVQSLYGVAAATSPEYLAAHKPLVKQFVAAISEAMAYNRAFAAHRADLIAIAAKYTGVTDQAALAAALSTQAKVAYPYFVCSRAKQQMLSLVKTGLLTTLPACGQVAALDVVPKQPAPKRK